MKLRLKDTQLVREHDKVKELEVQTEEWRKARVVSGESAASATAPPATSPSSTTPSPSISHSVESSSWRSPDYSNAQTFPCERRYWRGESTCAWS